MKFLKWITVVAFLSIIGNVSTGPQALADSAQGNFMVRVLGSGVFTQDDASPVVLNGINFSGGDADISDEFIPALTLTYFFNPNVSIELFCCFAKHDIDGRGTLAFGELADTWIFPPSLTVQYHFTGMGSIKPYVGAGLTYINFFDEGVGAGAANALNAIDVDIDAAFGLAVQAGVDINLGGNWWLNADVKKIWLETDATWTTAAGAKLVADVDLDPLIVSAGIGYRFNLSDLF